MLIESRNSVALMAEQMVNTMVLVLWRYTEYQFARHDAIMLGIELFVTVRIVCVCPPSTLAYCCCYDAGSFLLLDSHVLHGEQIIIDMSELTPLGYRACWNGQIIHGIYFCDGIWDCDDGSDEIEQECCKLTYLSTFYMPEAIVIANAYETTFFSVCMLLLYRDSEVIGHILKKSEHGTVIIGY